MSEAPSLLETLAARLAEPVGESEYGRARLHLLDWLACVAGARRSAVAEVARAAEPDVLTRAALLGSALEMDDVHRMARLHPGPVVWPAALSALRQTGGGMDALLVGGVRGYEAMIAVGATFDTHHYSHFHNTSTAGGFGGAAAASSVFGLGAQATVWAMANAGSVAGGVWHMRHDDVMTKAMHVAHASLQGLWQARLARSGFNGPARLLEGPQGLYSATTRTPLPLLTGGEWRMAEVSFKPWAACRHAHPAIDAALELRAAGVLEGAVRVETYGDAVRFCDRPEPRSETEAKFSLQHAVAVVMDGRAAGPEDFTVAAIEVLAPLRAMVSVAVAGEIDARYPAHFGARVTAGGTSAERIDTRGDPERPVTRDDIIAKAESLARWGRVDGAAMVRTALEGDDAAAIVALLEAWL